jgi:hypothetical protein
MEGRACHARRGTSKADTSQGIGPDKQVLPRVSSFGENVTKIRADEGPVSSSTQRSMIKQRSLRLHLLTALARRSKLKKEALESWFSLREWRNWQTR